MLPLGIHEAMVKDLWRLISKNKCFNIFTTIFLLQATVYLLEKLEVLLSKSSEEETKSDVLPLVFNTLESNSIQGQVKCTTVDYKEGRRVNINIFERIPQICT